jgi:hypothetical protein
MNRDVPKQLKLISYKLDLSLVCLINKPSLNKTSQTRINSTRISSCNVIFIIFYITISNFLIKYLKKIKMNSLFNVKDIT